MMAFRALFVSLCLLLFLFGARNCGGNAVDIEKPTSDSYGFAFTLTRDGVKKQVGYAYHSEELHNGAIIKFSLSSTHEHYTKCDPHGRINVYRILMYPNLYPYWPHLHYGHLNVSASLPTDATLVRQLSCDLTPNENHIFSLVSTQRGEQSSLELLSFNKTKLKLDFGPIRITDTDTVQRKAEKHGFHITHPRDEYNIAWTTAAPPLRLVSGATFPDTASLITSPDSQSLCVTIGGRAYLFVVNETVSNAPKDNLYLMLAMIMNNGNSPITTSAFSSDSSLLFFALEREIEIGIRVFARANGEVDRWQKLLVHVNGANKAFAENEYVEQIVTNHNEFCQPTPNKDAGDVQRCDCVAEAKNHFYLITSTKRIYLCEYTHYEETHEIVIKVKQLVFDGEKLPSEDIARIHVPGTTPASGATIRRAPELQLSPDDKLLFFRIGDDIQVLERLVHGKVTEFRYLKTLHVAGATVSSISAFSLKYYYLNVGLTDGRFIQVRIDAPRVDTCDPKARTQSFYLPAPPIFSGNQTDMQSIVPERDGIIRLPTALYLVVAYSVLLLLSGPMKALENRLLARLRGTKPAKLLGVIIGRTFFYVLCLALLAYSTYEIFFMTDFFNDWPAHLHHVEQFLLDKTLDYDQYMHYHGPNTYPAGFLYLYSILYKVTGGCLQYFQLIWAITEVAHLILMRHMCVDLLQLPSIIPLFMFASNRLHLYNVRVVINDFPSVVLVHLAIYLLLKRRYTIASLLYSFVVSTKLNFVFYSPAALVIYLNLIGFKSTLWHITLMGALQVVLGLPFLLENPRGYLSNAFDFSRTLLWEKTRNFKFVGRVIYDDQRFHLLLIALIAASCLVLVVRTHGYLQQLGRRRVALKKTRTKKEDEHDAAEIKVNRLIVFLLFSVNFFFVAFARGLYTPFMCWYFYTLPVIMYCARLPFAYIIGFWATHEAFFRFFGNLDFEMWATFILFLTNCVVILKNLTVDLGIVVSEVPPQKHAKEE